MIRMLDWLLQWTMNVLKYTRPIPECLSHWLHDKDFTDNIIYEKLLNDKLSTNLGYVYENVIAQMLRTAGKQLFYHTIPFADGKKY